jgi:hypothetical protein
MLGDDADGLELCIRRDPRGLPLVVPAEGLQH